MNSLARVNINEASADELAEVSGIGPVLAQRIIDHRPYANLDDLTRVPGIGEKSIERLKPNLTVETSTVPSDFQSFVDSLREGSVSLIEEETPSDSKQVEDIETDESTPPHDRMFDPDEEYSEENSSLPAPFDLVEKFSPVETVEKPEVETNVEDREEVEQKKILEKEKSPEEEKAHPSAKKEPELQVSSVEASDSWVSRSQLIWSLVGTAVFSIILTILITLGILSATNGGLKYATLAEANRMDNQINSLNDLTTGIQNDIKGIRTRLDALETVAGRVSALENRADTMEKDISTLKTSFAEMSDTIAAMQNEISLLKDEAQKSQGFRSGLLQLLMDIENPPSEGK